jgi:hypothetical protein
MVTEVNVNCCESPSIRREYFAFRWMGDYTCFGRFFPSDSCLCCGSGNVAFSGWKHLIFGLLNLLVPWDGAMCLGDHS